MSRQDSDLAVTIYTPESPLRQPFRLVGSIVRDIATCRELTWVLFLRDLKAQFRQSFLGYLWLVFPPLANALIWHLLNNQRLINVDSGEIPYGVFVLVGSTLWTAFGATLLAPSDTIVTNRQVFMKLNVPMEPFVLAGAAKAFFNFVIASLIILPLILLQGIGFGWTALLFPFSVFALLALAFTIGMLIAPLGVFFSDFRNAFGPILAVLMFTAPVVFPIPEQEGWIATVMKLNPITPSIALTRDALFTGDYQWLLPTVAWLVITLVVLLATAVVLRVCKPHMVQRMGM